MGSENYYAEEAPAGYVTFAERPANPADYPGAHPTNGYRLYDIIGNTWEWATDWYQEHNQIKANLCCGTLSNLRGAIATPAMTRKCPMSKFPAK